MAANGKAMKPTLYVNHGMGEQPMSRELVQTWDTNSLPQAAPAAMFLAKCKLGKSPWLKTESRESLRSRLLWTPSEDDVRWRPGGAEESSLGMFSAVCAIEVSGGRLADPMLGAPAEAPMEGVNSNAPETPDLGPSERCLTFLLAASRGLCLRVGIDDVGLSAVALAGTH
eukprot:CAMPEP_0115169938 /NCGR_PEP_ID=MMETSP0270-20121206/1527_1 /TAXON_ID=71861 /ORGANISM="Scrippsiella trochoidea, Strain CCMP3099" /LENGTH=169 /DNA_ID=CAMNT_0002582653 /DNA_START=252 /DNA_END=764 /DNA_ORIENTATION=-